MISNAAALVAAVSAPPKAPQPAGQPQLRMAKSQVPRQVGLYNSKVVFP